MASVAGRYARALFEAGRETGSVARLSCLLEAFSGALTESAELRGFLTSGIADRAERKNFLGELFPDPDDGAFLRFLCQLVDKNRVEDLPRIALDFGRLELESRNVREALVESPFPVDGETLRTLREVFRRKTGASDIKTTVRVAPELIGGIRVTIGSSVYDGTVRTELDRLHGSLTK